MNGYESGVKNCPGFSALTNAGDYVGTYCCMCGKKEADHKTGLEWSELWSAMKAAPTTWQPTTAHMYEEMLGCVPPRNMGAGAFLVGEADHHNSEGRAVYACFKKAGTEFEARYMTHAEFVGLKSVRA